MRKRTIKLLLSGENILGKDFLDFEQIIEIEDKPESYAVLCTNTNIKKWEFLMPSKYSNIREVLEVSTKILEDAGARFSDVKAIMCLTQIVCDIVIEEKGTEELSRRLLKNKVNSGIQPEVGMLKSMMGRISLGGDLRKVWIDGIIKCISTDIEPILGSYIRCIYA